LGFSSISNASEFWLSLTPKVMLKNRVQLGFGQSSLWVGLLDGWLCAKTGMLVELLQMEDGRRWLLRAVRSRSLFLGFLQALA